MINDMLKTNDPEKPQESSFSQSRVYLMLTVIVMMVVIISSLFITMDVSLVSSLTDILFYMMLLFSGYSVSGKGMATMKKIQNNSK